MALRCLRLFRPSQQCFRFLSNNSNQAISLQEILTPLKKEASLYKKYELSQSHMLDPDFYEFRHKSYSRTPRKNKRPMKNQSQQSNKNTANSPKVTNLTVLDSTTTDVVYEINNFPPPKLILPTSSTLGSFGLAKGGKDNCSKCVKFPFFNSIYPRKSIEPFYNPGKPCRKRGRKYKDCPPDKKCLDPVSIVEETYMFGDDDCPKKQCPKRGDNFNEPDAEEPCRIRGDGTKICPPDLLIKRRRKPPKPKKRSLPFIPPTVETPRPEIRPTLP